MALKVKKESQTPLSAKPPWLTGRARYLKLASMPRVATALEAASGKKLPVPCMTPSPMNTKPLMDCSSAPMMEGVRAAACTSGRGEKVPSKGREASCAAPRANPSTRPHASRRFASARAASLLLTPGTAAFPSSAGTSTEATPLTPNKNTPPSCQSWMVMAWAAAKVPVASSPCVVRVTDRNAVFSAKARSCTAAPPTSKGFMRFREGGFTSLRTLSTPSFASRPMYANPAQVSASAVAMDAPATPSPALKMSKGSNTTLISWVTAVILSGVKGSSLPR
mmetsp:Transcript_28716/g.57778  ORF Transcript_28716/g.57778 Transcript_28716/m.57778 type:complete len:279 (+) Transcript_28716:388-1224(+)